MSEHNELRRQIAEALGWKLEHRHYPEFFNGIEASFRTPDWIAIRPDGSDVDLQCSDSFAKTAYWEIVPDWPGDADAALALCLEIARKRESSLMMNPVRIGIVCWFVNPDTDEIFPPYHTSQFPGIYADEPAEALANLALTALEAQAVSA